MDKEYAQKILEQNKKDYNAISGLFSSTRKFVWRDLIPLLDYTKTGDKVLDVGCGNGRLFEAFKGKGVNYIGIDNSEELIKIAKKTYPEVNFQVADILKIPFENNSFDKVYCVAVLHHIPSKELRVQALKELKRVLKPNGLLVLTVWNLWQGRTSWRQVYKNMVLKAIGKTQLDPKDILTPWKDQNGKIIAQRYIHAFTKKEIKSLAVKSGLMPKEVGITSRPEMRDNNIFIIATK